MSPWADATWVELSTVVEEKLVRELIPSLCETGARGVSELPLDKIVE